MMPAASTIFDFLSTRESCSFLRHEIASGSFGALRRALGSTIKHLRDSQDREAADIADQLRTLLFTWLTSPVEFNAAILDSIRAFGDPASFEMRWGLWGEYRSALRAASDLLSEESPLRAKLRTTIRDLRTQGISFKIFCHRKARPHFDSVFLLPADAPLAEACFLHSVRDYANTTPFGALIKVGPLRSAGWGAAPDALVSAPRFENLVQILWSGCADEPTFGYDPVAPPAPFAPNSVQVPAPHHDALVNNVSWQRTVTRSGEDPLAAVAYEPTEDEFYAFREPGQPGGRRPATCVEIAEGGGILYPPHALVLTFDPSSDAMRPFGLRHVGEALTPGMFLIMTHVGDVDFGGLLASEGLYSRIWKARLKDEMRINPEGFCRILQNMGVALLCIRACAESWCKPSSTVIHAPQQRKHFKLLIDALAIPAAADGHSAPAGLPWWQRAWNEIRISRGEAIQAGVQGHEAIENQAIEVLNGLLFEVRRNASASGGFRLPIPAGNELRGGFVFHRIVSIEEGFLVPETELKVVCDLDAIEQWKTT